MIRINRTRLRLGIRFVLAGFEPGQLGFGRRDVGANQPEHPYIGADGEIAAMRADAAAKGVGSGFHAGEVARRSSAAP
jgi:hypothetical protein